jgi:hypothetical protein
VEFCACLVVYINGWWNCAFALYVIVIVGGFCFVCSNLYVLSVALCMCSVVYNDYWWNCARF